MICFVFFFFVTTCSALFTAPDGFQYPDAFKNFFRDSNDFQFLSEKKIAAYTWPQLAPYHTFGRQLHQVDCDKSSGLKFVCSARDMPEQCDFSGLAVYCIDNFGKIDPREDCMFRYNLNCSSDYRFNHMTHADEFNRKVCSPNGHCAYLVGYHYISQEKTKEFIERPSQENRNKSDQAFVKKEELIEQLSDEITENVLNTLDSVFNVCMSQLESSLDRDINLSIMRKIETVLFPAVDTKLYHQMFYVGIVFLVVFFIIFSIDQKLDGLLSATKSKKKNKNKNNKKKPEENDEKEEEEKEDEGLPALLVEECGEDMCKSCRGEKTKCV